MHVCLQELEKRKRPVEACSKGSAVDEFEFLFSVTNRNTRCDIKNQNSCYQSTMYTDNLQNDFSTTKFPWVDPWTYSDTITVNM